MIAWPPTLVEAFARRRCVLIIGAGVSASAATPAAGGVASRSPKTWRKFLADATASTPHCPSYVREALRENRLLDACQYLKELQGEAWLTTLREEFVTPKYKPSLLHESLYKLDIRTTISLNFDTIYEKYVNKVTEGTFIVKNYYDADIRQTVAGTDRYLLKMHGTVDTPARMIFTGKDYAKARTEHRGFYEVIGALLHTHICLLIGCGLNDPDVQLLFEDYRHLQDATPHYQTLPSDIKPPVAGVVRETRGINILSYSKRDAHKELVESLEGLNIEAAAIRDDLAVSRDW